MDLDIYKRFRYNFYYWLKNFKQTEDGQFILMDPITEKNREQERKNQDQQIYCTVDPSIQS